MRKLLLLFTLFISLTISAQDKQSVVKLKNGTTLKGVIKSIDPTGAVVIEIAGVETSLNFETVQSIEELGNSAEPSLKIEKIVEKVVAREEDPLKGYKGFLLEKGNNVFIESSCSDGDENATYDKEGAMVIREMLKMDGFWNVVKEKNQAHFIIHYFVNTNDRDYAHLFIDSWRTGKTLYLAKGNTNESDIRNNILAQHFYNGAIKSLQKKIENNKASKKIIEDFTIK